MAFKYGLSVLIPQSKTPNLILFLFENVIGALGNTVFSLKTFRLGKLTSLIVWIVLKKLNFATFNKFSFLL